ncbi:hypothetical protein [Acidicapsa ligni]|uniref:hypothetical protein n=1 Tax=Acidicapsa ligni TaxID=542300 RepID=UPI0021E0D005|nr:hypothetical protein [Acidicapsa ligni]
MEVHSLETNSSVPPPLISAPRTQKARGIAALAQFQAAHLVPPFQVYPADRVLPEQLIGYFSRPCPMRPRHGFVDSRTISNVEDGQDLIRRTLDADPEAEIVTMPLVKAAYSGIWTRGSLTVGMGHDGATCGTSAWSIPALGNLVSDFTMGEAGVQDTPYVEVLWPKDDSGYRLVQLRDGPELPQTADFIPGRMKVERVIVAYGDLLAWEEEMQDAETGTVVYHPNGSLASHYAIHAVLNCVPLLISREPQVGEWLEPKGEAPRGSDIEALRAGFHLALSLKVTYEEAAHVMLAGCHHLSVWTGKHDDLLGLALGFAYRLTIAAALGEMRHVPDSGRDRDEIECRDDVYDACWNAMRAPATRSSYEAALRDFHGLIWKRGYGGAKWFYFARWAALLHNHLVTGEAELALQTLNQLVHCAHNNGWAFNKFVPNEMLTQTARNPISTLILCGPLLYRVHRFVDQRRLNLSQRFLHHAAPIRIPVGEPNFEVIDEEEREDDWSERRSCDVPLARRKSRSLRRGVRVRTSALRRFSTAEDIPF